VTPPAKLAGFAAVLAALFGGGALLGGVLDPAAAGEDKPMAGHADAPAAGHGEDPTARHGDDGGEAAAPVRGLAVADRGLRVEVERPELRRDRAERLRFRIVGDDGEPVREFEVTHERRMHLIVVRRDLTGFQHLHPKLGADGTWTTPVRLAEGGSYRMFADFSRGGEAQTLATDLRVDGPADLRALPAPEPGATTGDYAVRLDAGTARPGDPATLRFAITRSGETVHTEPYLGAGGHLVALREGDLAFLHVHPDEHDEGGHDDAVGFEATFPTAGRYRLFLQFKHEGRVRTVAFTQEVTP
jgi:hypothetical protein